MQRDRTHYENHYHCGYCGVYIPIVETKREIRVTKGMKHVLIHNWCGRPIRSVGRRSLERIREHYKKRKIAVPLPRGRGMKADILANKDKWERIIQ